MGTYFNPGNEGFRKSSHDEIYVDKSGLLKLLNKRLGSEKNCISISHARRFGKSQAAEMIDAYYSKGCDSDDLFSGLEISRAADYKEHLNKYNVIHLDVSVFADDYKETLIDEIKRFLYDEMKADYPDVDYSKTIASVLDQVYRKSGNIQFVIIIDEWDCVIRNFSDNQDLVHKYMKFLHSIFKSRESKIFLALGYITGILPIKKIEDESAFNNFKEYTMLNSKEYTPYFGFTEDEVRNLCTKYRMNFDSVKEWYDGYNINGFDMYNPDSVSQALQDHSLESYWKNTSAFETVNEYITLNFDGLKDDVISMLSGETVYVNTVGFMNDLSLISDKDDALTALVHLGYLAYNSAEKTVSIPNYEVAEAYQAALKKGKWSEIANTISKCDELLSSTINRKTDKVAELIELAHEAYTSALKYNDENSLRCTLIMAYFTAPAYYNVIHEYPTGKGFADIVLIPRADSGGKPAIVIELKYDKDADTAIKQIKEKRYAGKLKGYGNEVLLVGINYDKDTKKHECVIEAIECV